MTTVDSFLQGMAETPHDASQWQILADCLEEQDDPRGELIRLLHALRQPEAQITNRRAKAYQRIKAKEERLRHLLKSGVKPCQPCCVNSIGMEFVLIPPGTFLMGTPAN